MDPILYWNDVALEANRVSHSDGSKEQNGPTLSSRALAIVHLAMYDAFAGASGNPAGLEAYQAVLPAPAAGASIDAAVAAAAHVTLADLFPSQKATFDAKLMAAGLTGPGRLDGLDYGQKVGRALLTARAADPDASDVGYVASTARGAHRPDPDNPGLGFHAPFYGAGSTCFATKRLGLDAPPAVSVVPGSDYVRALREVRAKGIAPELSGTVSPGERRTVDETLIGIYWGYDGAFGLGTPPRLYNQVVLEVAKSKGNTPAQNARLFALVNAAMGDAGILAWEQKYIHDYWRPVVGIREHDPSMGPTGVRGNNVDNLCHSLWLPLGAPNTNSTKKNFTPPFPAYPSGHATFGAAAFHITRLFYGVPAGNRAADTLFAGLSFVSEEFNGVSTDNKGTIRPRHVRSFDDGGLWQMIEENGRSRVYLGVHWVFDAFAVDNHGKPDYNKNIGGARLGIDIAEDIMATGLKATNGATP